MLEFEMKILIANSQIPLVFITPTHEWMARLSWPGWLVTYRYRSHTRGIEPGHGHPSQLL